MLRITVMWGKRLKLWNTMPTSRRSSSSRPRAHPSLVALQQPVGHPRHRDRDDDEAQRESDIWGRGEVLTGIDLGGPEALPQAQHTDERRVLLERDEVVEQRRDDA